MRIVLKHSHIGGVDLGFVDNGVFKMFQLSALPLAMTLAARGFIRTVSAV